MKITLTVAALALVALAATTAQANWSRTVADGIPRLDYEGPSQLVAANRNHISKGVAKVRHECKQINGNTFYSLHLVVVDPGLEALGVQGSRTTPYRLTTENDEGQGSYAATPPFPSPDLLNAFVTQYGQPFQYVYVSSRLQNNVPYFAVAAPAHLGDEQLDQHLEQFSAAFKSHMSHLAGAKRTVTYQLTPDAGQPINIVLSAAGSTAAAKAFYNDCADRGYLLPADKAPDQ